MDRVSTSGSAPRRIAVIGPPGSGKTTLARELATRLGVPHIEMDALHWHFGWRAAEPARFRDRLRHLTTGPAWVTDGNYTSLGGVEVQAVEAEKRWGAGGPPVVRVTSAAQARRFRAFLLARIDPGQVSAGPS